MSQSLHPMLNIAIKAARAAGAIINRGSLDLDLLKVTAKGPNDFVSEVDRAAEAAIIDILLDAYPGHAILAEESGREHGAQSSEFCWIIDPLDGTTNFLHGFPVYAVSIALAFRGVVQQAVVYDPNRNDLFYASRGRGAFLNDKRLRVSKRTRLADALIGTGFPFRKGDNFARYLKMFETVMQACAGLRRPGAAALDLCYVAAGWYDGFFETGLHPWDLAAGSLLITEAGGLVGNFTGESDFLYQREIVAGCPKVYGQLVSLLTPYSRVIKGEEAPADGPAVAPAVAPARAPADAPAHAPADSLAGKLAQAAVSSRPAAPVGGQAAPGGGNAAQALGAGTASEPPGGQPDARPPLERERKPVRIRKVEGPEPGARPGPGSQADHRPPLRGAPRHDSRVDRPAERRAAAGTGGPFKPRRKPGDTPY